MKNKNAVTICRLKPVTPDELLAIYRGRGSDKDLWDALMPPVFYAIKKYAAKKHISFEAACYKLTGLKP